MSICFGETTDTPRKVRGGWSINVFLYHKILDINIKIVQVIQVCASLGDFIKAGLLLAAVLLEDQGELTLGF